MPLIPQTYDEAVAYLSGLKRFGWKLDLERMKALCAAFGHPERSLVVAHVGGTNGKGSVSAMVAAASRAAGYRTGLYISPYVIELRERIQVDGEFIPQEHFLRLMQAVAPVVQEIGRDASLGQPTEFEVKTILGFLYFAERKVDLAVVEVGLGGRLDATNVVIPRVSAITSIGLDHVDRLGGTLESIAAEKAGIIKPGIPCVAAAQPPALGVIEQAARERGAPLLRSGHEVTYEGPREALTVSVKGRRYGPLHVGLRGSFQRSNAAVAVGALHCLRESGLDLPDGAIAEGLSRAYQPARLEVLHHNPLVVLDGAHNPPAAEALRQSLAEEFLYRRLILVVGMLRGHSARDVLRLLEPLADRVVVTAPDSPRAALPETLLAELEHPERAELMMPVAQAYARALELAGPEDLVLVTGSFYLMSELPRADAGITERPGVPSLTAP